MRKKLSLMVFASAALLLQSGVGGAAQDRGEEVTLWTHNLSDHPGRGREELLVLQVPQDFDLSATEVEPAPVVRFDPVRRRPLDAVERPAWVERLIGRGATLAEGSIGHALIAADDPGARIELAMSFREPGSAALVRLFDAEGAEVTSLKASSARPVRWRTSLGSLPGDGSGRVEVQVLRGSVQATTLAISADGAEDPDGPSVIASGGGQAYFSQEIHWHHSPPLYFSVAGAPAGASGDSLCSRNGSAYVRSPGWIGTDASGNATKGPWYWGNQTNDETAFCYIEWPMYGTATNTVRHVWDVNQPSTSVTSSNGQPPTAFSGSSTDASWGAGFNSNWSLCRAYFYNKKTSTYWTPAAGQYNTTANVDIPCTITGMPGMTVSWSSSQVPDVLDHASGSCYEWWACLYDGGQWGCSAPMLFCT